MRKFRHIIIIDDNADDTFLTKRALNQEIVSENRNIKLSSFNSGYDFLEYIRNKISYERESIDLILLDINLPFADGFDILKKIREDNYLCNTPVVMLSSSTAKQDIRTSYRYGANSYIQKPVDFKNFRKMASLIIQYWVETNQIMNKSNEELVV